MKRTRILESQKTSSVEDLGSGKYRVRIIRPGMGTAGEYLAENLEKSLPLFREGTQMYIDHPTYTEEWDRPERSLRDLAAKFITDAWQEEDGSLVTDIFVYESFRQLIAEKWEDIGISINAWSYGNMGPNGEVPPLDGLEAVDFVTKAGAGGVVLEMLESASQRETIEESKLDKELLEAIKDGFATLSAEIKESKAPVEPEVDEKVLSVSEALVIAQAIQEAELPEVSANRVVEAAESGKDYKEAIANEVAYIATIRESVGKVDIIDDEKTEPRRVSGFKKAGN